MFSDCRELVSLINLVSSRASRWSVSFTSDLLSVRDLWDKSRRCERAYVALLHGDFYVLPDRVLMFSLLVNSRDVAAGTRESNSNGEGSEGEGRIFGDGRRAEDGKSPSDSTLTAKI